MWGIIVFLTIGLYNMFKNPQSNIRGGNQIIFSEFLTSVDNGEVLKVEIQGNNIKGVFSNGNSFSTYSPNGAEVIKVEAPWGDDTRKWGPPFTTGFDGKQVAAYFLACNRVKQITTNQFLLIGQIKSN